MVTRVSTPKEMSSRWPQQNICDPLRHKSYNYYFFGAYHRKSLENRLIRHCHVEIVTACISHVKT